MSVAAPAALTWTSSYAAFSATTDNPANSWSTGSVVLTDDDTGTSPTTGAAMFSVPTMKPGATGSRCLTVTSSGSLPSAVRLYGTAFTDTKSVASYLTLTVAVGTGGSYGSGAACTGFTGGSTVFTGTLADFAANRSTFANGVTTGWSPTGTAAESRTFQFTWTFSSTAPDTTQGGASQITFRWEAQNS